MTALGSSETPGVGSRAAALLVEADRAEAAGDLLAAIDPLTEVARLEPGAGAEQRLASLRKRAFVRLDPAATSFAAGSAPDGAPAGVVPEVTVAQLSVERLRHHMLVDGCLRVRGLASPAVVAELTEGIDRSIREWQEQLPRPYARPTGSPWFDPLPVSAEENAALGRTWVTDSGGLLTADSPRMLFLLLELLESTGVREVARAYLGERPVLSANKCTLRKVPVDSDAGWHQDGAFLGRELQALNVWLALTPCGVDAPGLDIVPRRLDHIVETGTRGSYFDWAVGGELVEELAVAGGTPVVRPEFDAGDALLFDDLLLHRTATDPSMTHSRHAIETWCFAPSRYPAGHVPIVW